MLEADVALPVDVQAPARARAWLLSTLSGWGAGDAVEVAQLLVSELVTNAIRYGGPPLYVHASCADGGLVRVEVTDGLPDGPRLKAAGPDAESGRGLHLVEALSSAWGVQGHGAGKGVWFEVARSDGE